MENIQKLPASTSAASTLKMKKVSPADIIIVTFLSLLAVVLIFPFYNVFIISFGDPAVMAKHAVYVLPTSFDFSAYELLFKGGDLIRSFFISVFITLAGTLISMFLTTIGAYAISKKGVPGRKVFLFLILFTMFFNGGLVPYYLTIRDLGLINNILVMMLPMAINTYYMVIMMNFFGTLPAALEESAKIDGANDIQILFKIILPVSLPTIAAISLFYGVDRWNEWWHAMLFINDVKLYPLQLLVREMLVNFDQVLQNGMASTMAQTASKVYPDSLKMAIVVITTVPIMIVYPFMQKYFTKGIMIGSIKG